MGGCGDGDKRPCAAVRHSREQWDGACTEPGRWGRKCIALRCACIALQHGLCIALQHGLCITLQHGLCIALQHRLCIALHAMPCVASEGRGVTLHTAPRARAVAAPLRAPCNQSHALSAVQLLPWL